jgi:acyl-coenzyme A thioesterase PaaI-like protein
MPPAIHGGVTGAFLETSAIVAVTREVGAATWARPIGLTINYLRSGRALDTYADVSIVKQGRRVVAFEAKAWQKDPAEPSAWAFGHLMLSQRPRDEAQRKKA